MVTRGGSYDQVVSADQLALSRQLSADVGVNPRDPNGKVQGTNSGDNGLNKGGSSIAAFLGVRPMDAHQ